MSAIEPGSAARALEAYRASARSRPDDLAALRDLGAYLGKIGRLAEGEAILWDALARAPEDATTRLALGVNLLGQGRYEEGWPFYAAREQAAGAGVSLPAGIPCPRWNGEPLEGKHILVLPEQGLGDHIQFVRFLPRLAERDGRITLVSHPPLASLFQASFPEIGHVVARRVRDLPPADYWVTLVDLGGALGFGLHDLGPTPYLRTPLTWKSPSPGFKIGLITAGNAAHPNDRRRSLDAATADRLRRALPGRIVELDPAKTRVPSFAETAAIINQLDLVVSVDTAAAHLAGALGRPCLLLLPGFDTDWRWMQARGDTPWYRRHRLYRSSVDGDWSEAIERLTADAATLVSVVTAPAKRLPPERWRDALDLAQKAAAARPDDARVARQRGMLLHETGQLDEAERELRRALALSGDAPREAYYLSQVLLAQGKLAEGWRLHRERGKLDTLPIGYPRGMRLPQWEGEDLAGKRLVILPEQGFGDQIQFARFLPRLVRLGAAVTAFVPQPLRELFAFNFPQVDVRPAEGKIDLAAFDRWATLMDLPHPLGVADLSELGAPPYLRSPQTWRETPPGFKVGVQTAGNPHHFNDAVRSLPPGQAERLRAMLPGAVIGLDPAESGAASFADTAAMIEQLDLVISVDTSVAHLAGAMGKRCFLLLPGFATDWRWMRGREDSPWYPDHRLYRTGLDGGWAALIDRVAADARALAGG